MNTKSVASLSYIAGGKTPTAEMLAGVTQKPLIPIADLWNKDIKPLQVIMQKQMKTAEFMNKLALFPPMSELVAKMKSGPKPVPNLSTKAETIAALEAGRAIQETKVNKIAPKPSTREESAAAIKAHEEAVFAKHKHTEPSVIKKASLLSLFSKRV